MAAAMMRLTPMITPAMMIASAVFWSSSISLRTENGATFVMIQNAAANTARPMPANTADVTAASPMFSSFMSFPSVVAGVPEVIRAIAARRAAHARRNLVALGLADLAL